MHNIKFKSTINSPVREQRQHACALQDIQTARQPGAWQGCSGAAAKCHAQDQRPHDQTGIRAKHCSTKPAETFQPGQHSVANTPGRQHQNRHSKVPSDYVDLFGPPPPTWRNPKSAAVCSLDLVCLTSAGNSCELPYCRHNNKG
jgi:hypothetical protein